MNLPPLKKTINPTPKVERKPKNFRIDVQSIKILTRLASAYQTTEGKIIEQMLEQYGPDLIDAATKQK